MKQLILLFYLFIFNITFSQEIQTKRETKIADRYQSKQPQDLSVPPPPRVTFPAHFPDGNNAFLKINQNINKENLKN